MRTAPVCDAFAHTANYAHAHGNSHANGYGNSHANGYSNSHVNAKTYSHTEATPRSAGSPNTALKERSISDWPSGLTRR